MITRFVVAGGHLFKKKSGTILIPNCAPTRRSLLLTTYECIQPSGILKIIEKYVDCLKSSLIEVIKKVKTMEKKEKLSHALLFCCGVFDLVIKRFALV